MNMHGSHTYYVYVKSVSQLAVQIKLNQTWKSTTVDDFAILTQKNLEVNNTTEINLRPGSRRDLNESHRLKVAISSIRVDAAKLWNVATASITKETNKSKQKQEILKFCKTLRI